MTNKEPDKGTTCAISINGHSITVLFQPHSVHITHDEALVQLLENDREQATDKLVAAIRERFRLLYTCDLDINDASLAVEIWGHVYCAQLASVVQNLVQLKLLDKVADKVIGYCAVIDCGEKGYDSNRFFWDMLAPFKNMIGGWLPKNKNEE
jgi:hypothetical protein